MRNSLLLAMLAPTFVLAAAQRLVEGNTASPVRVLVYEDLQCPDCADFRKMLDEKLLPRYGGKVAFEHRDFPLAKHAWARKAAIAAQFFQETSAPLAVKYRRYSLANIKPANFNERLAEFAKSNGADPVAAVAALDDPRYAAAVEKDFQEGVARGVAHTPTAFVNGMAFVETITLEEISKAIDAALAESKP
jgi:protein-disulfide isomerase